MVWPDGSVHWVQGRGQVTLDANGDATGTMGCSADITEQKHAAERLEQALDAAHDEAEAALASAERLAFLVDVNEALARVTYTP